MAKTFIASKSSLRRLAETVGRHEEKYNPMKKDELNKLNFKDFLPVIYEDIEPHLIAELNRFRKELMELPEDTDEKELLLRFENSVKNLNKIDQDENMESGIDTEEREGLCDALYKIGEIVGLSEDDEFLDEWRDW